VEQVQEVNVVVEQFFLMQEQGAQVVVDKVIQHLHLQVQKLEQQETLLQ
jgi:hypothetical protein|tara:strand:+ start:128 stop:274 length:147 start_codon:yes stop_codon:yes gene_type:complete